LLTLFVLEDPDIVAGSESIVNTPRPDQEPARPELRSQASRIVNGKILYVADNLCLQNE
jgi:hypothetical protein